MSQLFPDKILVPINEVDGLKMSGINFGTAAPGWAWYYGKNDGTWWRCFTCGYTVDFELKKCPVCGHGRPQ